ncbi:hypothetical protein H6504_04915 [Candidatus Woesearchaeota archaeon]|nr:hypothetical protein [Candidatus Woesearchaeota archaeon]
MDDPRSMYIRLIKQLEEVSNIEETQVDNLLLHYHERHLFESSTHRLCNGYRVDAMRTLYDPMDCQHKGLELVVGKVDLDVLSPTMVECTRGVFAMRLERNGEGNAHSLTQVATTLLIPDGTISATYMSDQEYVFTHAWKPGAQFLAGTDRYPATKSEVTDMIREVFDEFGIRGKKYATKVLPELVMLMKNAVRYPEIVLPAPTSQN